MWSTLSLYGARETKQAVADVRAGYEELGKSADKLERGLEVGGPKHKPATATPQPVTLRSDRTSRPLPVPPAPPSRPSHTEPIMNRQRREASAPARAGWASAGA
jgi:hypothetical protein